MLVPICEECFNRYIKMVRAQPEQDHRIPKCKECLDIYMGTSNPVKISRPMQISGTSIREYYKLFEKYAIANNMPLSDAFMIDQFILGLSNENMKEADRFLNLQPADKDYIMKLVCYLSSLEDFRKVIFSEKDDLGPMDTI